MCLRGALVPLPKNQCLKQRPECEVAGVSLHVHACQGLDPNPAPRLPAGRSSGGAFGGARAARRSAPSAAGVRCNITTRDGWTTPAAQGKLVHA